MIFVFFLIKFNNKNISSFDTATQPFVGEYSFEEMCKNIALPLFLIIGFKL